MLDELNYQVCHPRTHTAHAPHNIWQRILFCSTTEQFSKTSKKISSNKHFRFKEFLPKSNLKGHYKELGWWKKLMLQWLLSIIFKNLVNFLLILYKLLCLLTLSEHLEIHSKFQIIESWIMTEVFKSEQARFAVCLKLSIQMKIGQKESVPITALSRNTK